MTRKEAADIRLPGAGQAKIHAFRALPAPGALHISEV